MRRGKTDVATSFAPSVLMASFVTWVALLLIDLGLVSAALDCGAFLSGGDYRTLRAQNEILQQ